MKRNKKRTTKKNLYLAPERVSKKNMGLSLSMEAMNLEYSH